MRQKIDFTDYGIAPKGWPSALDGVTVCHLSDLHSNRMVDLSEAITAEIHRRNPDLILASGDMTDCGKDRAGRYFFSIADRVGSVPIVCAPGNHERRIGKGGIPQQFAEACAARGIPYLDNTACTVSVRGIPIKIYGYLQAFVTFCDKHEKRSRLRQDITAADITAALGACETPSVLLAHDPMIFPATVEWGAPLVLSGHLHGGQIRLPVVGGLLSPARTFFPKYDAGRFEKGATTMLVSRGICINELPRIFNPPELGFITLHAPKEEQP